MAFWHQSDAYALQEDDEDSSDVSSSSEDEIDIILHGTPEQKRKLKRLQDKQLSDRLDEGNVRNQSSSSEDDFEKEMNAELAKHVDILERNRDKTVTKIGETGTSSAVGSKRKVPENKSHKEDFYDDVYFDSDEDDDNNDMDDNSPQPQGSRKHAVISNDDLLYDPTMDDKDQKWVDRQRRRNNNTFLDSLLSSQSQRKGKKQAKLPTSDALLDCPACLTTLCLDCQRHDTYKHQYRAMFVMNCEVDNTQMLQCPEQQAKGKRKKKKSAQSNSGDSSSNALDNIASSSSDLFHPVKCTECSTIVGVIDHDEVYHFFNVLASHT